MAIRVFGRSRNSAVNAGPSASATSRPETTTAEGADTGPCAVSEGEQTSGPVAIYFARTASADTSSPHRAAARFAVTGGRPVSARSTCLNFDRGPFLEERNCQARPARATVPPRAVREAVVAARAIYR